MGAKVYGLGSIGFRRFRAFTAVGASRQKASIVMGSFARGTTYRDPGFGEIPHDPNTHLPHDPCAYRKKSRLL